MPRAHARAEKRYFYDRRATGRLIRPFITSVPTAYLSKLDASFCNFQD